MSRRRRPPLNRPRAYLPPYGCRATVGVAERLIKHVRKLVKHWKGEGRDSELEEALLMTHVAGRWFADLAGEALRRRDQASRQLFLAWAEECFRLYMELHETWERRRLKASGQRVTRVRRHRRAGR